ncbi:MAG: hypothetical protein H7281_15240 [Bacteriovorax sp.]|nr:hypothetical protein [Bacteriovorax sp.]
MKLINDITELKKGDTIIVKGNASLLARGFSKVLGDILLIEKGKLNFTLKCKETDSLESINLDTGLVFLIN